MTVYNKLRLANNTDHIGLVLIDLLDMDLTTLYPFQSFHQIIDHLFVVAFISVDPYQVRKHFHLVTLLSVSLDFLIGSYFR